MNLQPVNLNPAFPLIVRCVRCFRWVQQAEDYVPDASLLRSPLWADLDGEAFKSYYCRRCTDTLEQQEDTEWPRIIDC